MPEHTFLIVPEVSSERREYVPIGFVRPDLLCSNLVKIISGASIYHFGVLSSSMHMAWMRQVCGRLESRYRYSKKLVYNNFPWPQQPPQARVDAVERLASKILELRVEYGDGRHGFLPAKSGQSEPATLADLYDPISMPDALKRAHSELDRAVEKCYRNEPFRNDRERVEFLFGLYEKLTAPLLPPSKPDREK
jgi:hypothetical protein